MAHKDFAHARRLCDHAREVPGACQLASQAQILDQIHESVITMELGGYIAARIEAEKTMRLQSRIFEHSAESILITDAQRRILSVNPAFSEITGYQESEMLGQTPAVLRSERHPERFYDEIWHSVEQLGSWHGEVWTRRKNGKDFPSWASVMPSATAS